MRLFITNLLATALVLFGATMASASSLTMTSDYAGGIVPIGTIITVELRFTATTTGVQLFGSNVLFDPTVLAYQPQANVNASYILYGMSGMSSTALYAQQNPWQIWPGINVPGRNQVNVNWADATFNGTYVTGANLLLAQLKFQVVAAGDGIGEIELSITAAGGIYQVSGNPTAPITLSGTSIPVLVPEPTTALLVGLGLVGLGVAGRRR